MSEAREFVEGQQYQCDSCSEGSSGDLVDGLVTVIDRTGYYYASDLINVRDEFGHKSRVYSERLTDPLPTAEDRQRALLADARVVAVDMDGTLVKGEAWDEEAVTKAEPVQAVIDRVNELSRSKFILILTARRDHLIPATLDWLRRNGVKFHAISNNKTPIDILIDDRTMSPEAFANG